MRWILLLFLATMLTSCIRPDPIQPARPEIHVAAASNLTGVLDELNQGFQRNTQIRVVTSFGATSELTQQIEAGAPFDILLAADVTHVDELIGKGLAKSDSKEVYAKGSLVVYAPGHPEIQSLRDLATPKPREIFIAKPELAPYGRAAVEALISAGIWNKLEAHTKYAPNISAAKQYADTGNCDAAFTALSLMGGQTTGYFVVPASLHKPIEQALCIMRSSKVTDMAKVYTSYLDSMQARAVWKKFGYVK